MDELRFENGRRRVSTLIPYEKNPRRISAQKKQHLTGLVERYGLISVPIIDVDESLVSGHQRLQALLLLGRGDDEIDVRVATRKMTEAEFKEVMVIENAKFGEWDAALLKDEFSDLLTEFDFGIDFATLDAEVKAVAGVEQKAEMPIVQKYSEQYSAIVIVCGNAIDENHLAEVLGLDTAKSYKSERTGRTSVIGAKQFIERWAARS